ncbi:MAG: PIN domain-containing protein [Bacteroidota bacterium]
MGLNQFWLLQFDETIKDIAINIKQITSLKTPDAIIAGTAIKYQLPLLTTDKEFRKVRDLDLFLLEL